MKRPAILFALAGVLAIAHLATRLLGWAEHTSAIAGMPQSPSSWVLGPAFIALHLAVVVVAPVLAIAATLDSLLELRRSKSRAPSSSRGDGGANALAERITLR